MSRTFNRRNESSRRNSKNNTYGKFAQFKGKKPNGTWWVENPEYIIPTLAGLGAIVVTIVGLLK